MIQKTSANKRLSLPHDNNSGARKNSSTFIVATTKICNSAVNLDLKPVRIQTAIINSAKPINTVKVLAYSSPNILATIA